LATEFNTPVQYSTADKVKIVSVIYKMMAVEHLNQNQATAFLQSLPDFKVEEHLNQNQATAFLQSLPDFKVEG
jgi:hypothetical protein